MTLDGPVPRVVQSSRTLATGWPVLVGDGAWSWGDLVVVPSGVLVPTALRTATWGDVSVEGSSMSASKAVALFEGLAVGPVLFPRSVRVSGRVRDVDGFSPDGTAVSVRVEMVTAGGGCGCGR